MSEQFVVSLINHFPNDTSWTVLDVGANHGLYTRMMAQKFGKVYAFEPITENVEILTKNIQEFNNVEIVQKAISNKTGEVVININPHNSGGHSISDKVASHEEWGFTKKITRSIPAITLDEFCKDKEINFIKFDIEGAEDFVFESATEVLSRPNLNILIEIHKEVNLAKLYDLFKSYGFQIWGLGLSISANMSHYETVLVDEFTADNHYFLRK